MTTPFADAVIVAAGSSTRMGGVDKLVEPLLGRPLLAWSIDAMTAAATVRDVIVVARHDRVDQWQDESWIGGARVVAGGGRRTDSVRAGVDATSADVVLVHDGARPLVSAALADAVARAARAAGAAVPAMPVVDSLKRATGSRIETAVERAGLIRAQTPQGARRDLLLDAFRRAGRDGSDYSDEAALLEAAGTSVVTVPGEAANIKVTGVEDLELVRRLARGGVDERTGFGEDVHGFGPGQGLVLGGVEIPESPRLHGHSDGDVVLHAIATAILGAAGLGDLGRLFPASDPQTEGVASSRLLTEAVRRALDAGWSVDRAHVSLVGARPRLGAARLDAMRSAVAASLGVSPAGVAIVASTGNLYGPEGAGLVIRATALVTLVRR